MQSGQLLFGFILLILTLLTLQPVKDLILGTHPDVHGAILSADSERVSVVVSNSGNGPAALEGINFTANKKRQGPWETVLSFNDIQDRLLKSGEIKIFSIRHNHQIPEVVEPGVVTDGKKDDCNLSVRYYELGGTHVMTAERFRCYVEKTQ
jgi:hypothetical protein